MKVSLTVVNTMCNVDKSLILAVRRTHVIHEPYTWQSSPQVLRSSVIRASHRCMVIGSISVGDAVFFLSSACDMLITSFLISSSGLNGVYHLSLFIRKHLYNNNNNNNNLLVV